MTTPVEDGVRQDPWKSHPLDPGGGVSGEGDVCRRVPKSACLGLTRTGQTFSRLENKREFSVWILKGPGAFHVRSKTYLFEVRTPEESGYGRLHEPRAPGRKTVIEGLGEPFFRYSLLSSTTHRGSTGKNGSVSYGDTRPTSHPRQETKPSK